MEDYEREYIGKEVLVTGGLGFIGSNLCRKLVCLGANVRIMDWKDDFLNIEDIAEDIEFVRGDVVDSEKTARAVREKDIIFNLQEVIKQNPLENPINKEQLDEINWSLDRHRAILDCARIEGRHPRVLYPSSKTVHGAVDEWQLPLKESSPLKPLSVYGMVKKCSEELLRGYNGIGLDTTILRLPIPYGPRSQIRKPTFGIVGWFTRQALEEGEITVYGEGKQKLDYIYVEDVVDAFIAAGVEPKARGQTYGIGTGNPRRFVDMARAISKEVDSSKVTHVKVPEDVAKSARTTDAYFDIGKITNHTRWRPKTGFNKGIKNTVEFYRKNLHRYL